MNRRLNDLQMYCVEEFVEEYHEGRLPRRELLRRVLAISGGVATTATVLLGLGCAPSPSASPTTSPSNPTASPATPPTAESTSVPPPTAAPASSAPSPGASPTVATSASTPGAGGAAPAGAPVSPTVAPTGASGVPGARSKLSLATDDPSVRPADVTFPAPGATIMGYLVRPKADGSYPAVLVCHENRGLTDHIRDVARRFAKAGYVALAVDLLSREGGTAKVDPSQVAAKLTQDPAQNVADFQAGYTYLQTLGSVKKNATGMVGFCFGGGVTWQTIEAVPGIRAAVPFYGPNPPLSDVPKIQAAVLGIYGGADQRIDAGISAIEKAMKDSGKVFEKIIYPGANHAFNNDTGPSWDPAAAYDAWDKTLAWMGKYLG
jgi:carboxymethylenebutenolidase